MSYARVPAADSTAAELLAQVLREGADRRRRAAQGAAAQLGERTSGAGARATLTILREADALDAAAAGLQLVADADQEVLVYGAESAEPVAVLPAQPRLSVVPTIAATENGGELTPDDDVIPTAPAQPLPAVAPVPVPADAEPVASIGATPDGAQAVTVLADGQPLTPAMQQLIEGTEYDLVDGNVEVGQGGGNATPSGGTP